VVDLQLINTCLYTGLFWKLGASSHHSHQQVISCRSFRGVRAHIISTTFHSPRVLRKKTRGLL